MQLKNLLKIKILEYFLQRRYNVLNSEIKVEGIDPFDFYSKLNVENDASPHFI